MVQKEEAKIRQGSADPSECLEMLQWWIPQRKGIRGQKWIRKNIGGLSYHDMYSLRTSTLILSIPKRSPSDSCSTNDEALYLQPQLQATKKVRTSGTKQRSKRSGSAWRKSTQQGRGVSKRQMSSMRRRSSWIWNVTSGDIKCLDIVIAAWW